MTNFFDKVLGGRPQPDKRTGKTWYQIYSTTLVLSITVLVIGILPELVDSLNGVPDPNALEEHNVRILETRKTEPHLFIEESEGMRRDMEWPVPISFHGRFRTHIWSNEEREALPGCYATVRGAPLRYTVMARYRIWSLDCPEKGIRIDFDKSKAHYESRVAMRLRSLDWFAMLVWGCLLLLVLIVFLREKRGTL